MQSSTEFQEFLFFGMFSFSFVDFMDTSGLNVHFYLFIEFVFVFVFVDVAVVFVFKKWKICTASLNYVCAVFDHSAMPCCCFSTRHYTFVKRFHNEMKIRYMYPKACPPCILNTDCWMLKYWKFVVHTVIDIEWLSKDLTQYILYFSCVSLFIRRSVAYAWLCLVYGKWEMVNGVWTLQLLFTAICSIHSVSVQCAAHSMKIGLYVFVVDFHMYILLDERTFCMRLVHYWLFG